jgi:O-antigen ligase
MNQTAAVRVARPLFKPAASRADALEPGAKLCFFFLCLFTLAIYGRPEDFYPVVGQMHLTLILGSCAVACYIAAWFAGNAPFVESPELKVLTALTAWFLIGVPFAYWRGGSLATITQVWFKTFLVFFLLTQTLLSLKRIRAILWAIIVSELAVSAYSVLNPTVSRWVNDRMSGVSLGILGWNFLGIAAALTIPYIAALFIAHRSWVKTSLLAACTAAMMWLLVLTASRSGMMTVAVAIFLTWLLILRGRPRGRIIGAGLVCALLVAVAAAPGIFWERMQTVWSDSAPTTAAQASAEGSSNERREALMDSIHYTFEHPLFGVGLGNFAIERGTEAGTSSAWIGAHNSFTEMSSEAGIPGLILFVALLFISIRSMLRVRRTPYSGPASTEPDAAELDLLARATLVSLLSFLFGALFAHIAYEYYLYYPIAIAVAIQHLARAMRPAPSDTRSDVPRKFRGLARVGSV